MAATRTAIPLSDDGATVREQALQLGPEGHLVGVLARPAASEPGTTSPGARPTMLFLNAGVIHRVGPHRLHVTLARRLAARGLSSLRLDLSGIGDSRAVPGSLSFRESAVADVCTAMDWLGANHGAESFVLFGLCSGADNALATASADKRVTGLVLIDPPAYVTPRARARKLLARMKELGGVREIAAWGARVLARRVRGRLSAGGSKSGHGSDEAANGERETPPLATYRKQLATLVERRVAILAVFSGALGERYNHDDQIFELFPELRGRIERAYFPAANHTFTERGAQAELVAAVTAWADRH